MNTIDQYVVNARITICWHPSDVYRPKGGQTVSLSPTGVYLESEETSFSIFIANYRSSIKNRELAITLFKMYLDEVIIKNRREAE